MNGAAQELAQMVGSVHRRLVLDNSFTLALAGGVLVHCELLRESLAEALTDLGIKPACTTTVPEPVAGCLRLARQSLTT